MAEDFDLASLATYLHLTPQQVDRLASRGKIPGRKLGGEWKFSEAEIHHWMEERMGLLEDLELAHVEDALARADNLPEQQETLASMLQMPSISCQLKGRTKNSIINEMSELAASSGMLWDAGKMADAVRARETLQSTAMDSGVALLHPRRPLQQILGDAVLAVGIAGQGIPFGGSSRLTDVFFLICSVDDRSHLRTLARLSRLLCDENFLPQVRAVGSEQELYDLIVEAEDKLT